MLEELEICFIDKDSAEHVTTIFGSARPNSTATLQMERHFVGVVTSSSCRRRWERGRVSDFPWLRGRTVSSILSRVQPGARPSEVFSVAVCSSSETSEEPDMHILYLFEVSHLRLHSLCLSHQLMTSFQLAPEFSSGSSTSPVLQPAHGSHSRSTLQASDNASLSEDRIGIQRSHRLGGHAAFLLYHVASEIEGPGRQIKVSICRS